MESVQTYLHVVPEKQRAAVTAMQAPAAKEGAGS